MAEATENIVAPLASPEPFFIAYSQKELAIIYATIAPIQKIGLDFRDHSFAKISANISNAISNDNGTIHILRSKASKNFFFHLFSVTTEFSK